MNVHDNPPFFDIMLLLATLSSFHKTTKYVTSKFKDKYFNIEIFSIYENAICGTYNKGRGSDTKYFYMYVVAFLTCTIHKTV